MFLSWLDSGHGFVLVWEIPQKQRTIFLMCYMLSIWLTTLAVNIDHMAEEGFARFLCWKFVLFFQLSQHCPLWREVTMGGWHFGSGVISTSLKAKYLHRCFKFFWIGDFSVLPNALIYSLIYWCCYKTKDIYFVLWIIIQCYFVFAAKIVLALTHWEIFQLVFTHPGYIVIIGCACVCLSTYLWHYDMVQAHPIYILPKS